LPGFFEILGAPALVLVAKLCEIRFNIVHQKTRGANVMANSDLILTLGKVLISTAWVDGELTQDEINNLKDLTFHLPELTTQQWAELEMYIDSPVGEAERARLVNDLKAAVTGPEERRLAYDALDALAAADGEITAAEQQVVDEIKAELELANSGFLGRLSRLMDNMLDKRTKALAAAPNREEHFEDYIKNKVYYRVQQRLASENTTFEISDDELRRLCLAGGIMGQVARVDQQITDGEFQTIVEALKEAWNLSEEKAVFVAEVAISDDALTFDHLRLAREFVKVFNHEHCIQMVDILFKVATADGHASQDEMEEIRKIARELMLSSRQFIDAKLKVRAELRE
jgi:uncharacterized tellurite resistance protein B-like protein